MSNNINYQINLGGNIFANIGKLEANFTEISQSIGNLDSSVNNSFNNISNSIKAIRFDSLINLVDRASQTFASFTAPGIGFEQAMADLSSITGIAGDELEKLGKTARQTGKESGLGANQAVKAFALLASQIDVSKIGVDGLELLQQKSITLAQAAGMSMDDAANSLAGTINQFGLAAGDAGRVINVLAAGSKYGAAEISDLALSFKVVGAAANAAGLTVEDTAGAIEVLSKNNLKGAEAGTALRNIMLKMQTTLGVDFSKNSLSQALDALKPKLTDAAYLSKVFGMENIAAAQFLIGNSEAVKEMTDRVTDTNVAQEQAAIRTQTTQAMMERCRATIDNLKIGFLELSGPAGGYLTIIAEQSVMISQLLPLMTLLTNVFKLNSTRTGTASVVTKIFGKSAKKAGAESLGLGANVAGAGVMLKIYGVIAGAQSMANYALATSFKAIGKAIMAIPLLGWILAIISAIIALVAWLWENSKIFNEFIGGIVGYFKYIFELTVKLWSWIWDGLVGFITGAIEWVSSFVSSSWEGICAIFSNIGEFFSTVWDNICGFFSMIGSWLEETVGGIWSSITGIFSKVINWFKSIFSSVGQWFTDVFDKAISKIGEIIKPIADFLSGLFGGMKDSIVGEAQKFGDNHDTRNKKGNGSGLPIDTSDTGGVDLDQPAGEQGGDPLERDFNKKGKKGGSDGGGSNSGTINLDNIVPNRKESTTYGAIAAKLGSIGMPSMATAAASLALPLAVAGTSSSSLSPETLMGRNATAQIDNQNYGDAGKFVKPEKFCDQIVINIASANDKGYDQVRDEIVDVIEKIMNDHEA